MSGGLPARLPVPELLRLRSSEASLLCNRGHVAGHYHYCDGGCQIVTGLLYAGDVVPFKELRAVDLSRPLAVENGWLIDGHHRLKRALADVVPDLPVMHVSGVQQEQRAYHAKVLRLALLPVHARPAA